MSLLQGFQTMRLVRTGPSLRERIERRIAGRYYDAVVERLRRFREELEKEIAPDPWTALEAPMVLLLSDVCNALSLTEEERAVILGQAGMLALAESLEVRFRPVPPVKSALNERQQKAVDFVRRHGMINLSTYRGLCPHWSDETLRLDLASLVRRGILTKNGARKGTFYKLAE